MSCVKIILFMTFLYGGLCIEAMDQCMDYSFRGHMFSGDQKIAHELLIDAGVYAFSPGELVFICGAADFMVPATIVNRTSDGYSVELIASSVQKVIPKEHIRKMSLLGHMLYQPNVPCRTFRDTVDRYLGVFSLPTCPFVQSCILGPEKKIIVVGDLHGCFDPLACHLKEWYSKGIITKDFVLNPEYIIVFTGDYIDRGQNCIEVLYVLMNLKITNPRSVFLIRGNHEQSVMVDAGDFYDEWLVEFGADDFAEETWSHTLRVFYSMPHAVVLGHKIEALYDCILFSHGGIEDIRNFLSCIIERSIESKTPEVIINHELPGLTEHNGFVWLDFYAHGPAHPTLICRSYRGERVPAWSWQFLSDYFKQQQSFVDSSKPYSYILRALCRGHQHMEGGITQLLQREGKHGRNWRLLADKKEYPIQRGDVFTFFSAADILPSNYSRYYAYGVISMKNNEWVLTPYIKEWFWGRASHR